MTTTNQVSIRVDEFDDSLFDLEVFTNEGDDEPHHAFLVRILNSHENSVYHIEFDPKYRVVRVRRVNGELSNQTTDEKVAKILHSLWLGATIQWTYA